LNDMSRISGRTFAVLNSAGVAVRAILMSFGGLYMGRVTPTLLADAKKYELATAALIAALGFATGGIRRHRRRQQ